MKRYQIVVAYDGTRYFGWQYQPGRPTIEEELNKALKKMTGDSIAVIGASRTDSGVHAGGIAAVFDSETTIPADRLLFSLNSYLPPDIRILASGETADDFHPRHCASEKTYEYHIQMGKSPLPTRRLYSHWVPQRLDVAAMEKAGQYLVGTHDFKSFCSPRTEAETTVRTIRRLEVEEEAGAGAGSGTLADVHSEVFSEACSSTVPDAFPEVVIRVAGNGFLYNMVRIISGTLIKVGKHGWPPEYVQEILEGKDRTLAGETAPAKGLFLKKIDFLD